MKWFSLAPKATRCFLNSLQYHHLHGGFGSHVPNSMQCSKSISLSSQEMHLSFTRQYTILNGTKSSYRSMNGNNQENNNNKTVDLEIISRETIKPAFPTPRHLKTYNLSIIDQFMFDCYTPLVLFLPNKNKATAADVAKRLKESLSEILTGFYPVAGEVKDELHIECNDKGVYFVEARVNQTLEDFLRHPDDQKVRELIPENFSTLKSSIGNYVAGVQVNIFNCGGIGLCTSLAHKIFDAHTYFMFMKAWAAAVRGSPETISPTFVASEIFPNNPSLKYSFPSKLMTTKSSLTTKRFFFDSTALALLKAQLVASSILHPSRGPTRMEATTALIWEAAAKAKSTIRPFSPQRPHALISAVNIRKRASPPLPKGSIGNLITLTPGICFPESQPDLPILIGEIRQSIAKINSESMKGEKGHEVVNGMLRALNDLTDEMEEEDFLVSSSLLNSGIYEIDFGCGKPVWFYTMNAGLSRMVHLNDTIKGGGVEAIVSLSSNEMEIFESDPAILSYATVNPSPSQYHLHD